MKSINVFIVEDELLIAETIKLYLNERGHHVVGIAISYEAAIQKINEERIDVILLDIRLYGEKSGIDVAQYLNKMNNSIPYIIVSSQYDMEYIEKAMQAGASGYIAKPISKESLWSTVEFAVLKSDKTHQNEQFIELKISGSIQRIKLRDIVYIKSDHVYVEVVCTSTKYLARYSFGDILAMIDQPNFIRCHRSYIINTDKIQKYSSSKVWLNEKVIPVSTKYKSRIIGLGQELK